MRLIIFSSLLFCGCFLIPFRGGNDPEPAPPPLEEPVEMPPQEPFSFERDTLEVEIPPQPTVPVFDAVKLWPNNENFWIVVDHPKVDKTGRRVRYNIRMQWRQICGAQDTDWYDMNFRGKIDPTDNDYYMKEGATLDSPDTVNVLASALRERDPSGTCEWTFRTRIEASPSIWDWSQWGELKFKIKLVDPRSIREIGTPRIDFVN